MCMQERYDATQHVHEVSILDEKKLKNEGAFI